MTDFVNGSAVANGAVLAIAANKYFSLDVQLGVTAALAATNTAKVTLTNTSTAGTFSPPSGSVVAEVVAVGLLGATAAVAGMTEVAGYSGDAGCSFALAISGGSGACTINGFVL